MTRRHSPSRSQPLGEVPGWDFDAEIIIVGFGFAGACAAIEAATAGARVALFEVASGSGGTSALASGYIYFGGGGGTPAQRDNGFADTTEDFYRYMLMAGGPDADEARVRLYADNALNHYHWLETQGVCFRNTYLPGKRETPHSGDCLIWSGNEDAWPFNLEARPYPRGHLPEAPGELGGKRLVDTLARRVRELAVEIHLDARVTALVADEALRVHGVVVQVDGQQRFARARKGVILCAGGFVLNQSMLQQYTPNAARLGADHLSAGHDDGSGISMGLSVGAAAIHMDELFTTLPIHPPESHVKGILVNERGQRFVNEDAYPGRVSVYCTRQLGDRIFLLIDDELFEQPSELSRIEVAAVQESWQALDSPPFAALACHIGQAFYPFFTLGGLSTLPTGEVLTANDEIVIGLYATGRNRCGLPRSAEGYSSGMSLGDCTFFGRLAGRTAAGLESTARPAHPSGRIRSEL